MKKATIVTSLAAVLFATNVQADTLLGLYIGGHVWANQADGSLGEGELDSDQASFSFADKSKGSYFIAVEHPIPLIPNIKIASTTLDTQGDGNINVDFSFGGKIYDANKQIDTVLDLSYIDYTLYYELFDNDLLTVDFGLTARDIEAQVSASGIDNVSQTSITSNNNGSGIVPMLYLSTIVGLPFTGFNVFAEANYASYDDQTLYDYQVGVSYEVLDNLAVDLNLTLGYREMKLELNDLDDLYSDLTFNGVFAGAIIHF